jgi:hypothetical protein
METLLERARAILLHPRAFPATVLAVAAFLLLQDGFYTLDGWAHLANARLLMDALTGQAWLDGFVRVNPVPVPNWGGHVVLASLLALFPPFLAEKLHWALLFTALAFGARRYLRIWTPHPQAPALLLLPVLLGQLFVLGFYNFLWGLAAACWSAAAWNGQGAGGATRWVLRSASTWLVWCCHGSCVPVMLLLVLAIELSATGRITWRRFVWPVLVFAPALAALAAFNMRFQTGPVQLMALDRIGAIVRMEWSVWYDAQRELPLTIALGAALLLAVLTAIRINAPAPRRTWPLLAAAAGFLLAALLLPDDMGYASYIGLRVATLAALLLVFWALAAMPHRHAAFAVVTVLALCNIGGRMVLAWREGRQALPDREVVVRAARSMRPGDVVLPIWRDDHWNMQHRVDLLAAAQPLRVLENYECTRGYFPLVWSPQLPPAFAAQVDYAGDRLARMREHLRMDGSPAVDHIVLMGPQADVGEEAVRGLLSTADSLGYVRSFEAADVQVWSRLR